MKWLSINGISDYGSYQQPFRLAAPKGRCSGAMDNFRSPSKALPMFFYLGKIHYLR